MLRSIAGPDGMRRRAGRPTAAAVAVLAALLAGCSAPDAPDGGSGETGEGYPLTVDTSQGEVTIPQKPERVVALGFAPADELISLGVEPVKVAADPETLEEATPWLAEEVAGVADAGLVDAAGEPNVEAVAAAEPDLIVAENYQVLKGEAFDRLNAVAPTVVPVTDALNPDWEERLLKTAEAVGRAGQAEELIAGIEEEFAETGASASGRTYQWVRVDPNGYAFGNGSVFELFGLEPAANQDNTQTGDPLPKENTADLDADLLAVWPQNDEQRAELDGDRLFQELPAVESGTVYYADLAFANAINSPAPIGLRWLRDELAPAVDRLD
ncbi:ABC transporter substrate-binding protein [Nocardiopsis composta]|uniref:Iron complex transport system substrate-binding protein n=1 Tax=Nocardiopsis composta TaxID=157465 RepID=A0A7W8QNM9_9ACTN|nr:ABC transporter substrate-binding protein [Nocardiopsis composta]MBB5433802.1 iron complex transport system substrate-binding protein [Nocardiopsis composta]